MNKDMYITEKIVRFVSLSIVGIAFNIAISYTSGISKDIASTDLSKKIESVQTISMIKTDNHSQLVELKF